MSYNYSTGLLQEKNTEGSDGDTLIIIFIFVAIVCLFPQIQDKRLNK